MEDRRKAEVAAAVELAQKQQTSVEEQAELGLKPQAFVEEYFEELFLAKAEESALGRVSC